MRLHPANVSVTFRGFSESAAVVRRAPGFTLIELILVMSILTIAVSITAPALANFFRGRSLDSEAKRLLALTRLGQSRAVSEGIPMELWVDGRNAQFGLEAEPSYEAADPKAVEFTLDTDMQLEAVDAGLRRKTTTTRFTTTSSGPPLVQTVLSRHADLPRIRFLPDGSIAETSPQKLCLTGRDGFSIWLVQSRNGLSYELSSRGN